ncbi:MAG: hypothetical protein JSV09_05930 [Thermoplasmata archaeon]|nr:MAG: hypothetical protein JSV09_05930 [Thermoplasmata archaeon]
MVPLEFEKPSKWSIGKKLGIIPIILLLLAPFQPYRIHDEIQGDEVVESHVSYYIGVEAFGFMRFLPIVSAILIAILLYLNLNLYTKKNSQYIKINHFILLIWGLWFFLTYLQQIFEHTHSGSYGDVYPGYGLWMMVVGSFLCMFVGFLEWRYPTSVKFSDFKISLGKKEKPEAVTDVVAEPPPKILDLIEEEKAQSKSFVKAEVPKSEHVREPEPVSKKHLTKSKKIEVVTREPTNEEEKILLSWARHINENDQTFEECIKCGKFVFLSVKESVDFISFNCPECGESFKLKK